MNVITRHSEFFRCVFAFKGVISLKKEEKTKRLRQYMLRNMMSLVAVSAVVIFSVTVLAKQRAEGQIIEVGILGDTAYFHAFVYDEDQSIQSGTLKVTLESQFDNRVQYIEPGLYTGYFENILANTQYTLSIKANEGFGDRVLASRTLHTRQNEGGKIIGYMQSTEDVFEEGAPLLISTLIADPENMFEIFYLDVTVIHDEFYTETYTLEVLELRSIAQLNPIYDSHLLVTLVLYGLTSAQERVDLDQMSFLSPRILYGSIYVEDASKTALYGTLYLDEMDSSDVMYRVIVKRGNQVIKTLSVDAQQEEQHYHGIPFTVTGLSKNTLYTLELEASYVNAVTQKIEKSIVSVIQAKTMNDHTLTIDATWSNNQIDVSILTDDPHLLFHNFRYYLYTLEGDYEEYLASSTLEVIANEHYSTTISTPETGTFVLYIYADKVLDQSVTYSWVVLRKMTFIGGE